MARSDKGTAKAANTAHRACKRPREPKTKESVAKCKTCRYDTNDFVAHPHCGGCDGVSKYVARATHTEK